MDPITRQSTLSVLAEGWGTYVDRLQALSPAARAAFLKKQGYARLGDLLAHIVAWWETGLQAIQSYRNDPSARQPEIDVDAFNARAVEQVRMQSDGDLILRFESSRRKFAAVLEGLSDEEWRDPRILNQLRMELIGHLEEHEVG